MVDKLTNTDLLVLGTLMNKPLHGYELKQLVDTLHVELWAGITLSSIYHSLRKLEKNAIVSMEKEMKGHMEIRIYTITELGNDVFQKLEFKMLSSFETMGPQFGIPLMFIHKIPVEEQIKALEQRRKEVGLRICSFEECVGGKPYVDDKIRKDNYPRTHDYLLWLYDRHVEWIDNQIVKIKTGNSEISAHI